MKLNIQLEFPEEWGSLPWGRYSEHVWIVSGTTQWPVGLL